MPAARTKKVSSDTVIDHPTLSFPDGNINLLSDRDPQSRQRTSFLVHKEILSVHSSVFRDMFSNPGVGEAARSVCKLEESSGALVSLLSYM